MVDTLAQRLAQRPDDAEGWTMLGRSYMVLERYGEAVAAYRNAATLEPRNAALLADFADAIAAAGDGRATTESEDLLKRALAVDPRQPKALALAGTIAFDRGDYRSAMAEWQKIADTLPPDSEFHRQVVANIDEARRRGNLPAAAAAAASVPVPGGHEAVTGTVTLSATLAAQAAPDDTVFVYAHPVGGRMPLAVMRAKAADLPLHFKLDDSMAMAPTMKLSGQQQVVVTARVSKSGNAITQSGDLVGDSAPIAPGTAGLAITIDAKAP
jgi:cytochrome c-type biogenesis protein CcmH